MKSLDIKVNNFPKMGHVTAGSKGVSPTDGNGHPEFC